LRNWIQFKDWTSQLINGARQKFDNKLPHIQVDFDE
jgi:hypothetical protein